MDHFSGGVIFFCRGVTFFVGGHFFYRGAQILCRLLYVDLKVTEFTEFYAVT